MYILNSQVLYTGQKTKKAKTWHDGTLKVAATGTRVSKNMRGNNGSINCGTHSL